MKEVSLPNHVLAAMQHLEDRGFLTYAVGGCIRDMLRGEIPHDYDLATAATPDQMKEVFQGWRTIETGLKHGTLTVLSDGHPLEITTFRADVGHSDGRHPDAVCFASTFHEDAARRDFTINAMAYRPGEGFLDLYEGQEDLAKGCIRTVGDPFIRFQEDALRILRAMRFASVLDFQIEPQTACAMHQLKELLDKISAERIREELCKLLSGVGVKRILEEFSDILAKIIPSVLPMIGFEQHNPHHIFDVYRHTLTAIEAAPQNSTLRMVLLLHDVGKPCCFSQDKEGVGHFYGHAEISGDIAAEVLKKLRFDNKTAAHIEALVRRHDLPLLPDDRGIARMRSRYGDAFLNDLIIIKKADVMGRSPAYFEQLTELDEWKKKLDIAKEKAAAMTLQQLKLNGEDLKKLGIPTGPQIGQLLHQLLEGVLDGRLQNDRQSLLAAIPSLLGSKDAPLEIERKFLIHFPDITLLAEQKGVRIYQIEQTYLSCSPGITERVRRRQDKEGITYFHTQKSRRNDLSAVELEERISAEEYNAFLKRRDPARQTVHKTRYTFPFAKHTVEIDIYPFWQKQAVLEVELASESEEFALPPFIQLLREVTADKRYKNANLAKHIPDEDDIQA